MRGGLCRGSLKEENESDGRLAEVGFFVVSSPVCWLSLLGLDGWVFPRLRWEVRVVPPSRFVSTRAFDRPLFLDARTRCFFHR